MGNPARILVACLAVALAGCSSSSSSSSGGKLDVLTTVSTITDIVRHVAGSDADVTGIIPEGADSHTFEPTADSARAIADADLILVNGLHLEDPTLELARSAGKDESTIVALGDEATDASEYIYDFSFPRSDNKPNPHLWMNVRYAIDYAELAAKALGRADPDNAASYESSAATYVAELSELDRAIREAIATIPPGDRVLLTYHDSFAYFAEEYGMRVIGAIQPSDFAEPSAQDVAELIDQIEREDVPAIFGSEVFPSPILGQIARETGVTFEESLRDDDLPGDPGDPEHSYVGLMVYDVSTIVTALGGDPSAIDRFSREALR
jgi:ABC-type Zn uptake system ZnuABC Zn-binding protein ZnuA